MIDSDIIKNEEENIVYLQKIEYKDQEYVKTLNVLQKIIHI